jgi:hypothetical protein
MVECISFVMKIDVADRLKESEKDASNPSAEKDPTGFLYLFDISKQCKH